MCDAILIVSFGGPERTEDVLPFLENVTRGRNIARERLLEVADHYCAFGGKSPINDQTRALVAALRAEFDSHGIGLPIYWGNRNWHPMLRDTLRQMRSDGVKRALAFITSAYSSYSSCRQYLDDIASAQAEIGICAPAVEKLRAFYNHPAFIEACVDRVRDALGRFGEDELATVRFVVSAHSIPSSMAEVSDYEIQLRETSRLVAETVGFSKWDLVFQSRSGPRGQPWLAPDILEHLRTLHREGVKSVLIAPLGFLSDHIEVLYDLDTEAHRLARELGLKMVRSATVGTHPAFIKMIRLLMLERLCPDQPTLAIGAFGPSPDFCAVDCCRVPPKSGTSPVSERQLASPQP